MLLLLSLLSWTNGQISSHTPAPQENPVVCLKNVELVYNATYHSRTSVLCLYANDNNNNNYTPIYEYPELETLANPNPKKCYERIIHAQSPAGVKYYWSWMDNKKLAKSWIDARNFCRQMCMDLVSLETLSENNWIKSQVARMKMDEIWTSGRLCDFKGCEYYRSPFMWPREDNGWFWAGSGMRIAPYEDAVRTDWSLGGPLNNSRQPDNKAHESTGKTEACIAIVNNRFQDGIHWHDEVCEDEKHFICEENDALLEQVKGDPDFS